MNKPLPPRKWIYAPAYIGHALFGFFGLVGIVLGGVWRPIAIVALALQATYQYVEFLRRGDTPGRDMSDIIAGYLAGVIGLIALLIWFKRENHGRERKDRF